MKRGRRAWILLAVWTGMTIAALSVPIENTKTIIGPGFDKVIHIILFTVMGLLAQAAASWYSLLMAIPVAVGMELLQKRLPFRTYEPVELAANILGVLLGIVCFEIAARLKKNE